MLPRKPRAVIFDLDGLLFDTETLQHRAADAAAKRQGHEMPLPLFHRLIGRPAAANRDFLVQHYDGKLDFEAFEADWTVTFQALTQTELRLKPGALELLDHLDAHGIPRAIATSSRRTMVAPHLAQHNLTHRFDAVITPEDYAHPKPDPDPFLTAAARLGIDAKDCLALEDSHNGVRSAAAAGMMTVMVPDMLAATDEMRALAVYVAEDLHEVWTNLQSHLISG